MKVTIVGGGSTYSPELVNGLAERASTLGLSEIVLQDPREDRLGPVGAFCARMVSTMGAPVTVRTTTSLDEALDGARHQFEFHAPVGCPGRVLHVGGDLRIVERSDVLVAGNLNVFVESEEEREIGCESLVEGH